MQKRKKKVLIHPIRNTVLIVISIILLTTIIFRERIIPKLAQAYTWTQDLYLDTQTKNSIMKSNVTDFDSTSEVHTEESHISTTTTTSTSSTTESKKNVVTTIVTSKSITNNAITTTSTNISTTSETELSSSTTETSETYPTHCLIIDDTVIKLKIGSATQKNIDKFDVVQDNKLLSTPNDIICFGHEENSFGILQSVTTDTHITLINYNNPSEYVVIKSELGYVNSTETNILSEETGESLLHQKYCDNSLRLITCATEYGAKYRWVVICQKVE